MVVVRGMWGDGIGMMERVGAVREGDEGGKA